MHSLFDAQQSALWEHRFDALRAAQATAVCIMSFADDHPIRTFERYWQARIKADDHVYKGLPIFKQFRPSDFRDLVKWMLLFAADTKGEEVDYRVRLAGSAVEAMYDKPLKDKSLADLHTESALPSRTKMIHDAITSAKPVAAHIQDPQGVSGSGGEQASDTGLEAALDIGIFPFWCDQDDTARIVMLPIPCRPALRQFL